MKKRLLGVIMFIFLSVNTLGCAPLVVGLAAGALGGYAVGRDSVQSETDKPYDSLWNAALMVTKIRGNIQKEDYTKGYLEAGIESSRVRIQLIRLTQATTRLKISSRKYHFPNLKLSEDIFVKIMEQAQ
jgi:hypothetical protein